MSYSASNAAAKSQSRFALLNAQAQNQTANLEGKQQAMSARLQSVGAKAQGASAENNAVAIQEQTEADSRMAQENIRRSREEFARTLGKMRAGVSDSGVLETTGSPLDFLVKASEDQQLYEAEQRWQDEGNRRAGFRQAAVAKAKGSQLGINASLFEIQGIADMAAAKVKSSQATMNGYAAQAQASGMRAAATAGLVNDAGGMGMSAYNMYQNRTPRRS